MAKEKFDHRLKDLILEEVALFNDGTIQIEGYDRDGKHVWMLIDISNPIKVHTFQPNESTIEN